MPCRLKMKTRTKHLRREIQRGDVFMKTEIEGGFVGHRRRDSIVRMLGRENLSESLLLRRRGGRELNRDKSQRMIITGLLRKMQQDSQRTSSLVLSAIIRWKPIPTPSMTPRKTAHIMAELRAALTPPRTAREPPVKKPAITRELLEWDSAGNQEM